MIGVKTTMDFRALHPNQSLKLTEPAVVDFARVKQPVTIGQDIPRAEWLPSLRQLSSGPLGKQK